MSLIRKAEVDPEDCRLWQEDLLQAYNNQRGLGWHNLMEVWIARPWRAAIEYHMRQQNSRQLAASWREDLIYKLLESTHHMWVTRNGVLHEKDGKGLKAAEGVRLHEDVEERFLVGDDSLEETDKHLLKEGLASVLKKSMAAIKA